MRHLRLTIALLLASLTVGFAQTPAPAKPPVLNETETLLVQVVQLRDALSACQQQQQQKQVVDLSTQVRQRLEAAHPGFTVDWKSGTLVAKPAPK